MIIKGQAHGNAGNLAHYLLHPKENETEFMLDLRDSASDDLSKSLTDWETIARCKTRGDKVLYHAHIRLRDGEVLHEAQWFKVIEDLETKLGFTNCPRAVVGHKNAEKGLHVHIVWSRLDPLTEKLASLSHDRKHHHGVARAAEKEFGLEPALNSKDRSKKRRFSDREIRALKDRGINKEKLIKMVRAAWDASDSGEEMRQMLRSMKVELLPGDRRDWVVEYAGLKMSPVRLLEDVNTAQFRERMKDVDLEAERVRSRETPPGQAFFGRKARQKLQGMVDAQIANDQAEQRPKTGFTKKKRRGLEPRLRPKLRYRDPGI